MVLLSRLLQDTNIFKIHKITFKINQEVAEMNKRIYCFYLNGVSHSVNCETPEDYRQLLNVLRKKLDLYLVDEGIVENILFIDRVICALSKVLQLQSLLANAPNMIGAYNHHICGLDDPLNNIGDK